MTHKKKLPLKVRCLFCEHLQIGPVVDKSDIPPRCDKCGNIAFYMGELTEAELSVLRNNFRYCPRCHVRMAKLNQGETCWTCREALAKQAMVHTQKSLFDKKKPNSKEPDTAKSVKPEESKPVTKKRPKW